METGIHSTVDWFRYFLCIVILFSLANDLYVEKTALKLAGDEITLDDDEILLLKADGAQIVLPREGLIIDKPYSVGDCLIFRIRNSQFTPSSEIVLTSYMKNARALIDMIDPALWKYYDNL